MVSILEKWESHSLFTALPCISHTNIHTRVSHVPLYFLLFLTSTFPSSLHTHSTCGPGLYHLLSTLCQQTSDDCPSFVLLGSLISCYLKNFPLCNFHPLVLVIPFRNPVNRCRHSATQLSSQGLDRTTPSFSSLQPVPPLFRTFLIASWLPDSSSSWQPIVWHIAFKMCSKLNMYFKCDLNKTQWFYFFLWTKTLFKNRLRVPFWILTNKYTCVVTSLIKI